MEGLVGLSTTSVNNLLKVRLLLKAVLLGLEPATSESLVRDLTANATDEAH